MKCKHLWNFMYKNYFGDNVFHCQKCLITKTIPIVVRK